MPASAEVPCPKGQTVGGSSQDAWAVLGLGWGPDPELSLGSHCPICGHSFKGQGLHHPWGTQWGIMEAASGMG